jgi:hypothetical protein
MLKKFFLFSLLITTVTFAQWVNTGAWPDTTLKGQLHGIAVDPAGKVWVGNFAAERFLPPGGGPTDSVTANLIRVYNPDGSPASFSPIWRLIGPDFNDTLKGTNMRGMRADHNGNILVTLGNQIMYRINYQTGAGMKKVNVALGTSPTAPAVSNSGQIFVGPVVNAGAPIKEFDSEFNFVGNVTTLIPTGFSRSMECSPDGNTVYFPSYTRQRIIVFRRPNEFAPFDSVGTIMNGVACESITRNRVTGKLWVAAGSMNDRPDSTFYPYSVNTWYEYDLTTDQITDSIKWNFLIPLNPNERPRGIDFSPNGNIAYFGCFGGSGYALVQRAQKTVDVKDEGKLVVDGYTLSQNYPNPFNPSTKINYSLKEKGYVTLKVYDMLGNEVATLVDGERMAGEHSVNFDASRFSSGMYVYQLNVNGVRISNKMTLMK